MELEKEIEKRKRKVERLEAKKKINSLEGEIEKMKRQEKSNSMQERFKVKSEVRKVEKKKAEKKAQDNIYEKEKEKRKIVLNRRWKNRNMSVEECMKENYGKVRIRTVVEKAEGVYSVWLERDSDREMLLGDRYRINISSI